VGKKAYFFFDHEYVCLGAGIRCELEKPVVATSINQCFLKGPVRVANAAAAKTAEKGRQTLKMPAWVLHDGVGYVFPAGGDVILDTSAQTGDWRRINSSAGKAEPISRDVFSLWIDQGAKPDNGGYAYVVVPLTKEPDLASYAKHPAVEIVANRPKLQAVWNRQAKVGMAAFYEAEAVELGGRKLTVDKPCVLLIRALEGKLELAVSTAVATTLEAGIEIDGRLEGDGASYDAARKLTRVAFRLSGERSNAGRPVVKTLEVGE
jgi:chondroitin AC lyase